MADYHCSVKTVSRSSGRSATGAAAYRSAEKITDQRTGLTHDYTRKSGVVSAVLLTPIDAPAWATDRGQLWNIAEQTERRKNSTVAREFEIALPAELTDQQRHDLAHAFAQELVDRHGFAADVCIHRPDRGGDDRNHHAHILTTTRRLTAEGFTEKARELDAKATGPALVVEWRERLAVLTNEALAAAGHDARVDHRSHADRGLDVEPTTKLGQAASALERKAQARAEASGTEYEPVTDRGRINAAIRTRNANVVSLSDRLSQVEQQIRAERLRLALFNQPAAQLQQQLQAVRNVGAHLQQNPQYAILLRQYQEAQRVAGYSREYLGMCRADLSQYEQAHPIRARAVKMGLRQPEPEHARLLQAVAEAEGQEQADKGVADALKADGQRLGQELQEHWHASEPERLAEAELIESVLADPEYQEREYERVEMEIERSPDPDPDPEPQPPPEPADPADRERRVTALVDALRGERQSQSLDDLAVDDARRAPRHRGMGPG